MTIDLDATLICAQSEKQGAAGTFKHGYGFAPMLAYGDGTGEGLAGELRPGNAGANNAVDNCCGRAGDRADPRLACSLDPGGQPRPSGHVAEITEHLDLPSWPAGSGVIVRRERAHPGAQLSFTDLDGHCFQAILTHQAGLVAAIERNRRGRARVEDHIRNEKDTGPRNLPLRDFEHNRVWLLIVRLAPTTSSSGPSGCF